MNQLEFNAECAHLFEALRNESSSKAFITNQILIAFCLAAELDLTPPPELVKFIAGGVGRVLQDSKAPWPTGGTKNTPAVEAALVQYINERFPGKEDQIAEHLGDTKKKMKTVLRRIAEQSDQIALYLNTFRQGYKKADLATLLYMLERHVKDMKTKVPSASMAGMSELEYMAHGLIEEIRRGKHLG